MGYYIKEGVTSIFMHSLISFASICTITAFLIIMGSFVLLAVNINSVIGELENENIILAYVDENLAEEDAISLGPVIRRTPNVTSARFISREDALAAFIGRYEDTERYKDVNASWFRHRYAVYVEDVALIAETQQALRDVYGIVKVNANLTIAKAMVTLRNIVRVVSIIIIAVLLAISLFIMSNTIRIATNERREEIAIMKIVGATNGFIRWPFIYEGFILGVAGSLAAFAAMWGLYRLVSGRMIGFEIGFISLLPFSSLSAQMLVAFIAIGFGVGVAGSGMALNRYLKV